MATHSSILTWKIPWAVDPGRLHVCGRAKSQTRVSNRADMDLLFSVAPRMPDGFLKRQCPTLSFHETLRICASGRAFFHTLIPSSATACYCWLLDARFMWPREILGSPVSAFFLISLLKVISSVQFSHAVMSDSLWPQGLQHARLPCPSPTLGANSNSSPSSQWCHPAVSFFVLPFSSHLQSFPASGSFPMSQLFASGGQSIGVSPSASVLPMNIKDWFPLGWTDLISLPPKDTQGSLTVQFKCITLWHSAFFIVQLSHPYMTTGNTVALTRRTLVGKVIQWRR